MIVVVADTSPLNYLIEIGCQNILPAMYGSILPPAVMAELGDPNVPEHVRSFMNARVEWLMPTSLEEQPEIGIPETLDPGEREAIQLMHQLRADILLMELRERWVSLSRDQGAAS